MAETLPETHRARGGTRGSESRGSQPHRIETLLGLLLALLSALYVGLRIGWALVGDGIYNQHVAERPARLPEEDRRAWRSALIMDWHTDSLLWNRLLTERSGEGHWDLPRAREGGIDLQMLTIVNQVAEPLWLASLAQGWPLASIWDPTARIDYQLDRFHRLHQRAGSRVIAVTDQQSLARVVDDEAMGLLLGLEGIHGIEGRPEALDDWYERGVRMASLVHRHDNPYGSSSGGSNRFGSDALTAEGRAMLLRMRRLGMILDLSHAAPGFIDEALEIYEGGPVVASHTGFRTQCDRPRNLSAEHTRRIAAQDGLVAVMFAPPTLCGDRLDDLVEGVRVAVELAGEDHVAFGTDWDGYVAAVVDASEVPELLAALERAGLPAETIRKVAGENSLRFLHRWLPASSAALQ